MYPFKSVNQYEEFDPNCDSDSKKLRLTADDFLGRHEEFCEDIKDLHLRVSGWHLSDECSSVCVIQCLHYTQKLGRTSLKHINQQLLRRCTWPR